MTFFFHPCLRISCRIVWKAHETRTPVRTNLYSQYWYSISSSGKQRIRILSVSLNEVMCMRILYIYSIDLEDLSFIITFLFERMFSLLLILALISQFSTASCRFFCLQCPRRSVAFDANNLINSTTCSTSNVSSLMCQAELFVDQPSGLVMVSSGGSDYQYNVQNGNNLTLSTVTISLRENRTTRALEIYCFNNQSCLNEINEAFIKGNSSHKG